MDPISINRSPIALLCTPFYKITSLRTFAINTIDPVPFFEDFVPFYDFRLMRLEYDLLSWGGETPQTPPRLASLDFRMNLLPGREKLSGQKARYMQYMVTKKEDSYGRPEPSRDGGLVSLQKRRLFSKAKRVIGICVFPAQETREPTKGTDPAND